MNTLVAVAIAPFGVGDELSKEVAEVAGYNNMMTEKIDRMENQM